VIVDNERGSQNVSSFVNENNNNNNVLVQMKPISQDTQQELNFHPREAAIVSVSQHQMNEKRITTTTTTTKYSSFV
jgi:hypothetical protein